jgi:alkylation response protein AidB-like acyl-CoA dehydrogenase
MRFEYAKEREIWGQPIGKYQAVGQMLVDMKRGPRDGAADGAADRLAECTHRDSPRGACCRPTMAKVYPAEMARRVTIKAMQIFGGSGYMKDYPLEKYCCAMPWCCRSSAAPTRS